MYPDFNSMLNRHWNVNDPISNFVRDEYKHMSLSGREAIASDMRKASKNSTKIPWATTLAYVACYASALSLYLPNNF
jgi:hypothetical protein